MASGHKSFSKERIEVFSNGRILRIDNFRSLQGWGVPGFSKKRLWRQNKGHNETVNEFLTSEKISAPEIMEYLFDISRISIEVADKLRRDY